MTEAPIARPRRSRRRRARIAVGLAIALLVGVTAVYAGAGFLAYQDLSVVHQHCDSRPFASQTPADFTIVDPLTQKLPDVTRYRFDDFTDVAFPTRGGGLTIRGWYAPPRDPSRGVVVVHGYDACRRDWNVLLPAGMLHRAGFGVLLPDLRNHGDSDVDDGRWAGGAKEYRDVLGAWDWVRSRSVPAARIGLFGVSLGAATTTIAMGEEAQVAALWADSAYDRYATAAAEYAETKGYPGWVASAAVPAGRMLGERELATREPGEEVHHLAGRPFFIVHGIADTT